MHIAAKGIAFAALAWLPFCSLAQARAADGAPASIRSTDSVIAAPEAIRPMNDLGSSQVNAVPWGDHPLAPEMDPFTAPASACSSGCMLNTDPWFVDVDFVYFFRSRASSEVLAQDLATINPGNIKAPNFPNETIQLGAAELQWTPGVRFTLGENLGRDCNNFDHDVEFTYLGLLPWHGHASLAAQGSNTLITTLNPGFPFFNDVNLYRTDYESTLNDYELNFRMRGRLGRDQLIMSPDGNWMRNCTPDFTYSFLAGLRYMEIDERFHVMANGTVAGGGTFEGIYDTGTRNDMVGPQIGGDFMDQHCDWNVGVRGKLGLLYNTASASRAITGIATDGTVSTLGPLKDHDHDLNFLGELSLVANYQIRPHVTAHASYDFIMATGTALAPDQVVFSVAPVGITFNTVLYHGLSLGLEFSW